MTMFCCAVLKPMRTMPDWSVCMNSAPRTAPGIVPMPPANEVPPMTAAAMTKSSLRIPSEFTAASSRPDVMAALIATSTPMSVKVFITVQRTLMPESSAASGLPPMAKT